MKVLDDKIEIHSESRGAEGERLEPEEKLARRVTTVETSVALGSGPTGGVPFKSGHAYLTAEQPAHEAARMLASPCSRCANWRQDLWKAERQRMAATAEGRAQLDRFRAEFMAGGLGAGAAHLKNGEVDHDVEHALGAAGICVALSAIFDGTPDSPVATMPDACCPEARGPKGEDLSTLFVPRKGLEAQRTRAGVYDRVMQAAQGRIKTGP